MGFTIKIETLCKDCKYHDFMIPILHLIVQSTGPENGHCIYESDDLWCTAWQEITKTYGYCFRGKNNETENVN